MPRRRSEDTVTLPAGVVGLVCPSEPPLYRTCHVGSDAGACKRRIAASWLALFDT
jgi:hypothetical protein